MDENNLLLEIWNIFLFLLLIGTLFFLILKNRAKTLVAISFIAYFSMLFNVLLEHWVLVGVVTFVYIIAILLIYAIIEPEQIENETEKDEGIFIRPEDRRKGQEK